MDPSSGLLSVTVSQKNVLLAQRHALANKLVPAAVKTAASANGQVLTMVLPVEATDGSLSVALTDAEEGEDLFGEDMHTRLLLLNRQKGIMVQPSRFLKDTIAFTTLLPGINEAENPGETLPANKRSAFISLEGIVKHEKEMHPVGEGTLIITAIRADSVNTSFLEVPVNKNGRFDVDSLMMFGNYKLYYKYETSSGKEQPVSVEIDKFTSGQQSVADPLLPFRYSDAYQALSNAVKEVPPSPLAVRGKGTELEEVFVQAKKQRSIDKMNERFSDAMYGMGGKLVLDNITNPYPNYSLSLKNYLLNNIRTIRLNGEVFVNTRNLSLGSGQMWPITVMIDNAPAPMSYVQSIRMDEVAFVKFYQGGSNGTGSMSPGGIIAVYLKTHQDVASATPSWINGKKFLEIEGYDTAAGFDTSASRKTNDGTLYWNPEVVPDADNKINIRLNRRPVKKMKLSLQGFDSKGRPFQFEKIFDPADFQ